MRALRRSPLRFGESLANERKRAAAEESTLEEGENRLRQDAEELRAQAVKASQDFEIRLAELTRERDCKLAELDAAADRSVKEADALRARRASLAPRSIEALAALVRQEIPRARQALSERLGHHITAQGNVTRARLAAVASAGEPAVREYEEMRRRCAVAVEPVEKTAYSLAERAQRGTVEAYAKLLDQLGGGAARVPIALFTSEAANGRLIVVVPVAPTDLDAADVRWRLGACLFDAAERVAREVSSTVTAGAVFGSLAVELRPWAVEAELFQVALEEAWEARPSLAASGLAIASEVILDHEPPFESIALEEPVAPDGVAQNDVRGVARRLGLSLADLIASLSASGLPVHDDLVEDGVEDSLRELLQGPSHEEPIKRASAAEAPAPASSRALLSARHREPPAREACPQSALRGEVHTGGQRVGPPFRRRRESRGPRARAASQAHGRVSIQDGDAISLLTRAAWKRCSGSSRCAGRIPACSRGWSKASRGAGGDSSAPEQGRRRHQQDDAPARRRRDRPNHSGPLRPLSVSLSQTALGVPHLL